MFVNGRAAAGPASGLRTYAREITRRLPDEVSAVEPPLRARTGVAGKVWEQTALAAASRRGPLWSPAPSGPLQHRRHVVTIHDLAPMDDPTAVRRGFANGFTWLVPRLARRASFVVTSSLRSAGRIETVLGVPGDRIRVVRPALPSSLSLDARGRDDARRSLAEQLGVDPEGRWVGGLVHGGARKRSHEVVRVLDEMVESGAVERAVVAGWGGPRQVFGDEQRPVGRHVVDLGGVADADLARLYRSLDVFVCAAQHEGFCMPVIEAAAAGAAVVTTPVPAAVEILGRSAWICDVDELSSATAEALADDTERSRRAARAAESAISLDWDRSAKEIAELLQELTP